MNRGTPRPLVTVKSLLAQARAQGAIELAEDALITPAAADWLATTGVPVRRAASGEQTTPREPALYLVGDAAHPTCRTLLPMLERAHGPVTFWPCQGCRAGLVAAVQRTCAALAEDSRRRGVVVVRSSALVSCIANKHPAVRAAIVSRPAQLAGLMREIGLNLLILEHETVSLRQMAGLIDAFLRGATGFDPGVEAALAGGDAPAGGKCGCSRAHG